MTIRYKTAKLAIEIYEADKENGLEWCTAVAEAANQLKPKSGLKHKSKQAGGNSLDLIASMHRSY